MTQKPVRLIDYVFYIGHRGIRGVEFVQRFSAYRGGDIRNGRLAGAGHAVKDHIRYIPAFDYVAKYLILPQYMLLTHYLVDGSGS